MRWNRVSDPEAAPRQPGRPMESGLVECLNLAGLKAHRLRLAGSKDRGDVAIEGLDEVVLECKDTRTVALSEWWKEAEQERVNAEARYAFVAFKRHGVGDLSEQWVLTNTGTLAALLAELGAVRNNAKYLRRRLREREES